MKVRGAKWLGSRLNEYLLIRSIIYSQRKWSIQVESLRPRSQTNGGYHLVQNNSHAWKMPEFGGNSSSVFFTFFFLSFFPSSPYIHTIPILPWDSLILVGISIWKDKPYRERWTSLNREHKFVPFLTYPSIHPQPHTISYAKVLRSSWSRSLVGFINNVFLLFF